MSQHSRGRSIVRETIEEQGFAILPALLGTKEVDEVLASRQSPSLRRSRAGARHVLCNSAVARVAWNPRILDVARCVLGKSVFPFRATLFEKSPTSNWLVVWHQDTALPLRQLRESPEWGPWSVKEGVTYAHAPARVLSRLLALRFQLDDSTERNGPLRVLPKTHTLGILTDDEIHQVAATISAFDCVTPKGSVLAMRPLLIHSSSKSQTDAPRRVLHIEYAESAMVGDGLELAVA